MIDTPTPTSAKAAGVYDTTISVFSALLSEVRELSKKKPDAPMSKFKVNQINRILIDAQEALTKEPEIKYLDLLSDEDLPQVADAVFVMSQYEAALSSFRERHFGWDGYSRRWFIES